MSQSVSPDAFSHSELYELPEDFITGLCSAYSSLKVSVSTGSSCSFELRSQASGLFEQLTKLDTSRRLRSALDLNTLQQLSKTDSLLPEYLDLSNDRDLKQKAEHAADVYLSLSNFSDALEASYYLDTPAKKAHAVAQAILKGYHPIDHDNSVVIGSGSFGIVTQVPVLGSFSAAKSIKSYNPEMREKLLAEAQILNICAHDCVIGLDLVDELNGKLYLEFASKGTLKQLCRTQHLSPETLLSILQNISRGCAHIHARGYIHKDLKLDNILILADGCAKISDFGSAIAIDAFDSCKSVGTLLFSAPEALKGQATQEFSTKLDVWSFGMLIWDLLKNDEFSTPFVFPELNEGKIEPKDYSGNQFMFIYKVGKHFKGFSKETLAATLDPAKRAALDPKGLLFSIMQSCLQLDPAQRPSMEELVKTLS